MKDDNEKKIWKFVGDVEVVSTENGAYTEHGRGKNRHIRFFGKSPDRPMRKWTEEFIVYGETMQKMLALGIKEGSRFWIHGYIKGRAADEGPELLVTVEEVSKLSSNLIESFVVKPLKTLKKKERLLDEYENKGVDETWLKVQRLLLEENFRCVYNQRDILYREMGIEY